MTVAVEVANGNLVGLLADGVGDGGGEGAILVVQKDADSAVGGVGGDQVRIAVAVEVAGSDPVGLFADCVFGRGIELAIAQTGEDTDGVVFQIADRNVEVAILVEVGDGDAIGKVAVAVGQCTGRGRAAAIGILRSAVCY